MKTHTETGLARCTYLMWLIASAICCTKLAAQGTKRPADALEAAIARTIPVANEGNPETDQNSHIEDLPAIHRLHIERSVAPDLKRDTGAPDKLRSPSEGILRPVLQRSAEPEIDEYQSSGKTITP